MRTRRDALAALGVALAGCGSPSGTGSDQSTPVANTTTPTAASHWYPHPQPTGNRTLDAAGNVRAVSPVTIPVENAAWLVALPAPEGSDWVIHSGDGTAVRYRVSDGEATEQEVYESRPGLVPVVRRTDGSVGLVRPPGTVSPMAPPAFAEGDRTRFAIGTDGDLLVTRDGTTDRVDVDALPDGRIVRVSADRYALLGGATDRYRHGALGDSVEGGSLIVVDSRGVVETRRSIDPPAVAEAQAPIAADLDGDGRRELLVPVSDSADGARVVAFDPDGTRLATGPIHGSGWRHPLAVAPFGPGGRPELAVVRKPHVEHVLEFYRLDGGLSVDATLRGFRSHTYGSRTLDGALAADLDGDGAVELLVPTTRRTDLAAVRRSADGAEVAWRLSLDGELRTNLTGVALEGPGVAVGAGTADGVRVWQGWTTDDTGRGRLCGPRQTVPVLPKSASF